MIRFIIYFLILLAAVWLGLKIAVNPGYMVIAYQHWTVETPLWLAIASILISFIVFYFLFRMIGGAQSMMQRWRAWNKQRRIRAAWQRTHRGLIALSACEWRQAEQELIRSATLTDTPIINYLGAARAAQHQNEYQRRDDHLRHIRPKDRNGELALGITQAELQLQQNQLEQSLATLQRLHTMAPKHVYTLLLLCKVYLKLEEWADLEALLPQFRKYKVYSVEELQKLEVQIYQGLLLNAIKQSNHEKSEKDVTANETALNEELSNAWNRMPRDMRQQPALLIIYAQELLKENPSAAEQLLKSALQQQWNDSLVRWYGLVVAKDADKQLKTAESWLKTQPNNASLLLALARICVHNQLWGKARSYFESSLATAPSAEAYADYAHLLEQLGESNNALQKYREGLTLAVTSC